MGKAAEKYELHVRNVSYLKEVFDSELGKDCLYDLCKKFHYFHTSYVGGDVHETIFREGERNVINYLMTLLRQSPAQMLDEFRKRQQEEMEYEN